jgi:hypothetical protein
VAPKVGKVEVYKVSHHGSKYSSNVQFLRTLKPEVGIISVGTKAKGNTFKHPADNCLDRLHEAGTNTYWTEAGEGAHPQPGRDVVGGNIVVEVIPRSNTFTVTYSNNKKDTYPMWETYQAVPPTPSAVKYAWSKKSSKYHYITCRYVDSISPQNLETGSTPPEGKTLHEGCPTK